MTASQNTKGARRFFCVVTVHEGGADFTDYEDAESVPISVNEWYPAESAKRVRQELRTAKPGQRITLDGCSVCFVLSAATPGSPA